MRASATCGCGLSGLFLLIFQNFAVNYTRAVGGVAEASRASQVTTTWRDHSLRTTRQTGEDVQSWGQHHMAELSGLVAALGDK